MLATRVRRPATGWPFRGRSSAFVDGPKARERTAAADSISGAGREVGRMGRIVVHLALLAGVALVLAGCGFADSHASLPEFMRTRTAELPPPEPPPDVRQLVRKNLDSVFVAASNPQRV